MEERRWTLADQARAINTEFKRLDRAHARIAKAKDAICTSEFTVNRARLNAGQALIEARTMLEVVWPSVPFETWCAENVKRSMRDCYACIALVNGEHDDDGVPQVASAAKETVHYQQDRSVQTIIGIYRKMSLDQRAEVKAALEEIDNA
jgi:hypothetical protein